MIRRALPAGILVLAVLLLSSCATVPETNRMVRVAVIGGLMRSELWPQLAQRFEAATGYKVELVLSGNRDLVADSFSAGELDLAVLHAGNVASALVTNGFAEETRIWVQNEFVMIGPRGDPAGVKGLSDGAEAFRRIDRAHASFVDYQNSGPSDVVWALQRKAGVRLWPPALLKTDVDSSEEAMAFASNHQAYLVLGRVPEIPNGMEIFVQGDPIMRREFVIVTANSNRFPQANVKGARALARFLESASTAKFLLQFATNSTPGMPMFYPARIR